MKNSAVDSPSIEKLIEGSEKLTSVFGCWPSFHDAEVTELNFDSGRHADETERWPVPIMTMGIVLWELTPHVKPDGYFETRHHTFAELRFKGVTELSMGCFGSQNAIFELLFKHQTIDGRSSFDVRVEPAVGFEASFKCVKIEVVSAIPCPQTHAIAFRY